MVRDHGDLARVPRVFRRADRPDLRHHRAGGDDFAVLCRHDRRPLLRDPAAARHPPCPGRPGYSLRIDPHRILAALWGHPGSHALLHADARAHQFPVVPADAGSRTRVSPGPRAWHDRLDRRGPAGGDAWRRGDGDASETRWCRLDRARGVLPPLAAYAPAENRPRERTGRAGARRPGFAERSIVC